jgi:endonuclease/exonuclease/phosphatase family metal-dependent hydrolase
MQVPRRSSPHGKLAFQSPPQIRRKSEPVAPESFEASELSHASSTPEKTGLTGFQKAGLGAITALSVAVSLTGAAGYAARHLPVCEAESGLVDLGHDQFCVSPELSTKVDAIYRGARGQLHRGDAIKDLASQTNRVLQPREPARRAPDGEFTVNSWNLHHGTSQNRTGARDQLDTQIDRLNESDADVDLLQEILPWHAQKIVDGTGKVGYYSQTTARQGNLVLVSPDLVVTENARLTLNHQIDNARQASDVVGLNSGEEPRAAQFLHLQGADTNFESVAVFNTHLSTGSATPQARAAEHRVLERLVDEHRQETDRLVGGGDLNTRDGQEIVQTLKDKGLRVEGATIDWLVSDNSGSSEVRRTDVWTENGTYVSDHPMVEGRYTLGSDSH